MKMNDGASADIEVSRIFKGRENFVMLDVSGEGEYIFSVNEACRILEVLYGYSEESLVNGKRPIILSHSVSLIPSYLLYNAVDGNPRKPDDLIAYIRPHEAIWLRLKLEQVISSCD